MSAEINKILPQEGTGIARKSLSRLVLGCPIVSEGNKFPYRRIGSSKLDCGDEVRHPLRLVFRRGETSTGQVRFGTLNVCGESVVFRKPDEPQFERPIGNHTFHIGKEAVLGCSIVNLGKHKV
ncbi:hypothetical protein EVAR_80115_1 [Eumeta japonica]|uniref:Uncharacterized protein n=1 Tax=Eumeta variegata TaxID=151549 RepID=A0A4C1UE59_EUMVA|nr:hypothetical protein EVAR_80115_1 [Eumeta japonica]